MNTDLSAEKRGQPFSPQDRPEAIFITMLVGFNDLPAPSHPCTKATWDAYVAQLKARYRELLDSKGKHMRAIDREIDKWLAKWKEASETKMWRKKK